MKSLVLKLGKTEFLVNQGENITIGREPGSNVKVSDTTVSKRHATIEFQTKSEIYLTDHNSTNGTYYNGVQIKNKKQINPPGTIKVGMLEMQLEIRDVCQEKGRNSHDTDPNIEIPEDLQKKYQR